MANNTWENRNHYRWHVVVSPAACTKSPTGVTNVYDWSSETYNHRHAHAIHHKQNTPAHLKVTQTHSHIHDFNSHFPSKPRQVIAPSSLFHSFQPVYNIYSGVKVSRNAPERRSGARKFKHGAFPLQNYCISQMERMFLDPAS